jgi:hypothetical protein
MMSSRSHYQIALDGARALRAVAARIRAHAERDSTRAELWLTVRDLEGLAGRLAERDVVDWEEQRVHVMFGGQDVGVLDELLRPAGGRAAMSVMVSEEERVALHRIRTLLSGLYGASP